MTVPITRNRASLRQTACRWPFRVPALTCSLTQDPETRKRFAQFRVWRGSIAAIPMDTSVESSTDDNSIASKRRGLEIQFGLSPSELGSPGTLGAMGWSDDQDDDIKTELLAELERTQHEISWLARTRNASLDPTQSPYLSPEFDQNFSPALLGSASEGGTLVEEEWDDLYPEMSSVDRTGLREVQRQIRQHSIDLKIHPPEPTVGAAWRQFWSASKALVRVIIRRHPYIVVFGAGIVTATWRAAGDGIW